MRSSRNRTLTTFAVLVFSIPLLYGGCNPCGNGKLDKGEECDDGNNVPGDGCSPRCKIESPENCTVATGTDFANAAATDAEVQNMLTIASGLHFGTTGSDVLTVNKCDEGLGTTSWVVKLRSKQGSQPDGLLVWRLDAPDGRRAFFTHLSSTQAVHRYVEFRDYVMDEDHSGSSVVLRMTGRDGTVFLPLPPGTAPGASAPASPSGPDTPGGHYGEPSPAFLDALVEWLGPASANAQAVDSCTAIWVASTLADAKYRDATSNKFGDFLGAAINCVLGDCSPKDVAQKGIDVAESGKPPPSWDGAKCTDLDCNRGKCRTTGSFQPPATCVQDNPPVNDCNTACNEQCDTTTGICAGAKVLAVSVPGPITDDEVWRCGGAQNLAGYDCPAPGDPFFENVVRQSNIYTPNLTVSWCGRLSQTAATLVTEECGTSPPGWTCTQGSSFSFDKDMPNPVLLPHPEWCCSLGSPLPATFGRLMSITTGSAGAGDKFTFNTSCQAQVSNCKLCDCTPPDDVGDIIDNPVCGWNGFQCPAN
jgi:cysteine-rich repeat protein